MNKTKKNSDGSYTTIREFDPQTLGRFLTIFFISVMISIVFILIWNNTHSPVEKKSWWKLV